MKDIRQRWPWLRQHEQDDGSFDIDDKSDPTEKLWSFWTLFIILCILLGVWVGIKRVNAEPPPGTDPNSPISQWFRELKQPINGVSCCSISDCRPEPVRVYDGHYQAWHEGTWLPVPDEAILPKMENPVGEAVVCIFHGTVLCLVRGPES